MSFSCHYLWTGRPVFRDPESAAAVWTRRVRTRVHTHTEKLLTLQAAGFTLVK